MRAVGAFLLFAAGAKAMAPDSIRPIFAAMEVSWTPWHSVMLVMVEGALGCALIGLPFERRLRWLIIGLLITFTGVLAWFGTMTQTPSCGCLEKTRLFHSARSERLFGISRNLVFLSVLIGPAITTTSGGRRATT
ncbi:MAG: hypothetical protein U0638_08000 [Phycisphaerales bacterium]